MNDIKKNDASDNMANRVDVCQPRDRKKIVKSYICLHILLILYSVGGICSKTAASYEFMSLQFVMWYGGLLLILVVYALAWQQVLKNLNLTTAYANKGITIIWGFLWGGLLFGEQITWNMILGGVLIIIGVVVVVKNGQ